MGILSGFFRTKKYRKIDDETYKLQSEWTSSDTVEFSDGKTAQEKLGDINGITSSLTTNRNDITASAASVKFLQDTKQNSTIGTKNRVLISDGNGKINVSSITTTLLNFLSGLNSNVQTQLDILNEKTNNLNKETTNISAVSITEKVMNGLSYSVYRCGKFATFKISGGALSYDLKAEYGRPYSLCRIASADTYPHEEVTKEIVVGKGLPAQFIIRVDGHVELLPYVDIPASITPLIYETFLVGNWSKGVE